MMNDEPLVIVPTDNIPKGAAPVAPIDNLLKKIKELDVTAVVLTVAVPPTKVTEPKLFAPAAIVVPTLALRILLPAVAKFKLPFRLIFPDPALIVVVEVVLVEPIMTVLADAPFAIVTAFIPAAVAILTVAPAVVAFAIETVPAPAPLPIRIVLVPEEEPIVIAAVCAVPPIKIVPVVVEAPTLYVDVAAPLIAKLPVPTNIEILEAPDTEPIVITLAPAEVARFTALPAVPTFAIDTVVAPVPAPIATMFVPEEDPKVIVPV
jgi:hypothetical protein